MSEFKDLHPACNVCGSPCDYQFTPSVVQFALKDGPSGSWPSKGNRFKKYRAKRSEEMKVKQKDRYGHLRKDCIPNYRGVRSESWEEAQSMAMKDKDNNPDSLATAATYVPKIEEEKRKKGNTIVK